MVDRDTLGAPDGDGGLAPGRGAGAVIEWLFRDRATGRIVIAQWPNLSLGVFLVARIADRLIDPANPALEVIGTVALLWWAGDEVVRGVNPWRRILGTVVAVATVVGLLW